MIKQRKEIILIGAFLLILLALFIILNFISPLTLWDENVYLGNARSHVSSSNFTEDFRFPLTEYIIAFFWKITGENLFVARLIIILMTICSALLLYLIGKRFFSRKFSFLLSALFALSPLILFWGFRVYADIPAMFFTTLSFYFLIKNNETSKEKLGKRYIFIALAGFCLGLAFLARFPLAILALCAGLYLIVKKRPKELLLLIIFFLIAISPWLIYNQIAYHHPFWDILESQKVIGQWTSLEPISKQIINLFYALGILIIPLIIGLVSFLKKEDSKQDSFSRNKSLKLLIASYVILSFIYYLFFVKLKDARYYLAFLPFLYILSIEGIIFLKNKLKNKKIILTILIIVIINSLILLGTTTYLMNNQGNCDRNNPLIKSMTYLKPIIQENDTIVSNCWPWFGYYLNAHVYSPWTNTSNFIKEYNATRFITCSWFGPEGEYKKEVLEKNNLLKLEKEFNGPCNQQVLIYRSNSDNP